MDFQKLENDIEKEFQNLINSDLVSFTTVNYDNWQDSSYNDILQNLDKKNRLLGKKLKEINNLNDLLSLYKKMKREKDSDSKES